MAQRSFGSLEGPLRVVQKILHANSRTARQSGGGGVLGGSLEGPGGVLWGSLESP